VKEGKFREDLYYRLKVIRIELPPLRERKEDIDALVICFLNRFCEQMGKPQMGLDAQGMKVLKSYDWPGNIRELQNLVEMLVALCDPPVIPTSHIVKELYSRIVTRPPELAALGSSEQIGEVLIESERRLLIEALERNEWNKTRTAQELGWHRNTIEYKMKKLGIVRPAQ
jgi:two-component system response regulator AtoC